MSLTFEYLKATPLVWVTAAVTLAGAVLCYYFVGLYLRDVTLRDRGVETQAEVLRLSRHTGTAVGSAPLLTFAFQDRNGLGFQGQAAVRSSAYRSGDKVSVTYDSREPASVALTAFLASDRETRDQLIMALVGALMLVGAAIPTGRILARALTVSDVMSQGRAVEGTVVAVHQRTTGVGRNRPSYLEVEYPGPTARPLRTLSDDVPRGRLPLAPPGARVKVMVDRRIPSRAVADVWGWR